ncbi:hypothetical protein SEUCBS140593_000983, partial [Sporothrix eucalyptigena]
MSTKTTTTSASLLQNILDTIVPSILRLSPDGKHVVYSAHFRLNHKKGETATAALWIAETGVSNSARQFTDADDWNGQPEWSPDGQSIAFVSNRANGDAPDTDTADAYNDAAVSIKAAPEKKKKISTIYIQGLNETRPRKVQAASHEDFSSIPKIAFSPDGSSIAFIAASPSQKKEDGNDAIVWGEKENFNHLWLVDVSSGALRVLFDDKANVSDFVWTDDDEIVIVTKRDTHEDSQYLHGTTVSFVNVAGRRVRPFFHVPRIVWSPVWLNGAFYFIGNNIPTHDTSGFAVFRVKEGHSEPEKVAQGEVDCAAELLRIDDDVVVHVEHGFDDRLRLVLADRTVVTQKTRVVSFHVSGTAANLQVVVAKGDVNTPTELFTYDTSSRRYLQLSNHGRALSGASPFGYVHFLLTKTFDNKEDLANLYLVPAQHGTKEDARHNKSPTKPLPTFVFLHGGPYGRRIDAFDNSDMFSLIFQILLREGCGILAVNYRGSSGRGERFASYARAAMGSVDESDVVASVQDAITRGYIDPKHVVAGGWSQGGFLSYLSAVRNGAHGLGWKFSGLIAGAGVTDWDSMVTTSDVGAGYESQLSGGAPWALDKNDVQTRAGSALWEFNAAAEEGCIPPMLMLHGEKDERVPISQAWGFQRALDSVGLPFT